MRHARVMGLAGLAVLAVGAVAFAQTTVVPLPDKAPGETAPLVYVGVHICKPQITALGPEGPFSLTPIWKALAAEGRVHGVALGEPSFFRLRDGAE